MGDYQSTFSIPGISSSIDWGSMADKLIENARKSQEPLVAKQDTLELKIGLFNEFSASMKTMRSAVTPLKLASTFQAKAAEFTVLSGVNAQSVVTATVSADAAVSRHEIEVLQKAVAQSRFSARIETTMGDAGLAASQSFYINVGGRRAEIQVSTTDSLTTIAQKISDAKDITLDPATGEAFGESLGITATVIDNRLVIRSANTGLGETTDTSTLTRGSGTQDKLGFTVAKDAPSNGTLAITAGTVTYVEGTDFTVDSGSDEITWIAGHGPAAGTSYEVSYSVNSSVFSLDGDAGLLSLLKLDDDSADHYLAAQDAELKIDGLTVTRSSNQIDDLIEGVKLTVNGAGSVVMDITQDAEQAVTGIQDYVTAFNDLMDWINIRLSESSTTSSSQKDDQYKNDDFYKKFGLLHGNSMLWQTKSQIRQLMTDPVTAAYTLKTGRPVLGTMESAGQTGSSTFTLTVGVRTAAIEVTPSDTLQTIASKINSSYEMTHDPQGRTYPIPMASAKVVNNQLVIESSPNRKFSLAASDNVLDTLGLGTPFNLLSQIGISTESSDYGKSGKLEFDSDKFMEALRNDPDGVAAIMNTVMGKMDEYIGNMVDTSQIEVGYTTAPKGRIASQITTWQTEIATIDKRIAESEARLELRARGLYEQFAQAEVNLAKLQQQSSWLASVVSQLSGGGSGS